MPLDLRERSTKIRANFVSFPHNRDIREITSMPVQICLILFPKERCSSKHVNTLILKTILFIPQNMFQSIHTSSSVAKNIIKTVNILNLHVS